ncbi:hypothetical protein HOG48_00730 [Candidatus Peregrinibacteria bacterium]|jgi:hypothetical protein|nr:hypothetical protein [Candidatus Peregrinibacteria bacterium]
MGSNDQPGGQDVADTLDIEPTDMIEGQLRDNVPLGDMGTCAMFLAKALKGEAGKHLGGMTVLVFKPGDSDPLFGGTDYKHPCDRVRLLMTQGGQEIFISIHGFREIPGTHDAEYYITVGLSNDAPYDLHVKAEADAVLSEVLEKIEAELGIQR